MRAELRKRLSMAARARDFAVAHPSSDASYMALVARLQDRVTRGEALTMQQGDGTVTEHAATSQRTQLKGDILKIQLKHLVLVARLAVADHPEMKGLFVYPDPPGPHRSFIATAKTMAAAAETHKDLFLAIGIGDTFLDELNQAIAAFDTSTDTAHTARREHVGAGGDLNAVVKECVTLVGALDGLYRVRFRNDAESLAAWNSSRNIVGSFKSRRSPVEPAPSPEPEPAPSPVVALVARPSEDAIKPD